MNKEEIRKELLTIDVDEDIVEDILNRVVDKNIKEDEEVKKNIKIKDWNMKKNVEIDWKKKAILASKIIKINI